MDQCYVVCVSPHVERLRPECARGVTESQREERQTLAQLYGRNGLCNTTSKLYCILYIINYIDINSIVSSYILFENISIYIKKSISF